MKQELIIKDAELYRALKTLQVSGKLNRFGVYDVCIEDMTEIENAFYFKVSNSNVKDLSDLCATIRYAQGDSNDDFLSLINGMIRKLLEFEIGRAHV